GFASLRFRVKRLLQNVVRSRKGAKSQRKTAKQDTTNHSGQKKVRREDDRIPIRLVRSAKSLSWFHLPRNRPSLLASQASMTSHPLRSRRCERNGIPFRNRSVSLTAWGHFVSAAARVREQFPLRPRKRRSMRAGRHSISARAPGKWSPGSRETGLRAFRLAARSQRPQRPGPLPEDRRDR